MLNLQSLREQVYAYLREEMHQGRLLPGSAIDQNLIASKLGISKTPLRDALIRLESEGFVKILPRRGVVVASLTIEDVRNLYEMIGIWEGGIITDCFDRLKTKDIDRMERLNEKMRTAVRREDYDSYYNLNLEFHGVYVELSDNREMKNLLTIMKRRLYDFPRRSYIQEWELSNCDEHETFIGHARAGDAENAASIMRDVHWSFAVQETPIRRFYSMVEAQIKAERDNLRNSV